MPPSIGQGQRHHQPRRHPRLQPGAQFQWPVEITYAISDGKGGSATSTVTVNVTPVNDPPVANPSTATTPEETPVTPQRPGQ
jgi:hypothetical protein